MTGSEQLATTVFKAFLKHKLLPSPELMSSITEQLRQNATSIENVEELLNVYARTVKDKSVIVFKELFSKQLITQSASENIDWHHFEQLKFLADKGQAKPFEKALNDLKAKLQPESQDLVIEKAYKKKPCERNFEHFTAYYLNRYKFLSNILRTRDDSKIYSISRVLKSKPEGLISIIGMVVDKQHTRNNNLLFILDDPTGSLSMIVTNADKELFNQAVNINLDEVILVTGILTRNKALIASKILLPSFPEKQLTSLEQESYIAFIGDTHFGSKLFLKQEFSNFLRWINQETGSEEQKLIASKVKWVVITGDLVEGVGIYPNQEEELIIKDIYEQYNEAARWLERIPKQIKILIIPGNHDAVRIEEPQPPIPKKYASKLYELENVVMLPNPSWVRIGGVKGLLTLLYHGFSMPYYADQVETIRQAGGQKRPDLIMQYLLERRHLAPSHNSNLYIPDPEEDPLLITKVPDLFVTGHIHRVSATNYKNVTLINSSCWTKKSKDQERRGLEPQPGRVILVNTKSRDIKILNFYQGD